ncbi:hypothetical protein Poly51_32580 [Rubripirellula tenax]|uniref:DUF1552 domain-containing protein n=1 Tax=Rubripirellula tenax TaxID=2528015 RepID=A0A5C6F417_9BACT|nr:DUF1552 domain-containing protein [Rubripirellula tenax]TWU54539.1 hypothetical protein Poly51_32580 [Rubripirellula tenax]
MKPPIHRRRFLNKLSLGASAPLLGPMLARIASAAEGELPPQRFLFVVEGNSLPPKQVHPEGIPFVEREDRKTFSDTALGDLKLPTSLAPIDAYRDRLSIIQGLSGRMCTGGHSSNHGTLGAYHANLGRNVRGATIDGLLGQIYPGIFPNVVLGISSRQDLSVDFNISASAPGKSLATICDPRIAFSRLFGSAAEGAARREFVARQHLLDHMGGDIKRARAELNGVEKDKIDTYLESFETLRTRSGRLVEVRDKLKVPVASDKFSSREATDKLDAHIEIATASLIGGLTNCVTIASGVGFPNMNVTFSGLGINRHKHIIGHALYNLGDKSAWEESEKIRAFHFELIARTMAALDGVPEGDGTMLDRTTIVYLSDGAETHHSRCYEWPMVVISGSRGGLKGGGRYLQYPDYGLDGHRTMNCLFNTLLHSAGTPRDDFGSIDPNIDEAMHRGPLQELLS